ncbi:MAG: insulinase family protein [Candidatus Liptonbacteria bacterium]|nr:insulinase family protein [Candidatus Liptonbacteria bacterium]
MSDYRKLTLSNGLRVLLVPQPKSLATTVLILVEAGSEYETKNINGLSHFLEHLVFKGTAKRPKPGMIASELDSLGAEYNAFTSYEYTGYWAKAQSHKLTQVLELVSDLYLNPIFEKDEIEKERGVIIEEINLYEDTPSRKIHDLFSSLLYGNQPAGWDIAGSKEVIRNLSQGDFIKYRNHRYVAGATIIVVAGSFNEKKIEGEVRNLFSHLPRRSTSVKPTTSESQSRPQSILKFKESDQTHLVLGTRAFDIFDKRRYIIQVLADVLGGGMSSRLFHRVREELGAAYYIRAGCDLLLDHGYFGVSAGVDHAKIEKVVKAILEELSRVKEELVPASELQKSKDHLIGSIILGLETSDELASFYGSQEILTKEIVTPDRLIKKVQAVKTEDLKETARAIFRDEKLNLAVIGPYKNEASFKKILKF